MDSSEAEFLKRIQATFQAEAEEHIQNISRGLIELEKSETEKPASEIIETIFREVHSLKGAARSVDRNGIESICQVMEDIFEKLKQDEINLSLQDYDLFHHTVDTLKQMVNIPDSKQPSSARSAARELIRELEQFAAGANVSRPTDNLATPGLPRDLVSPADPDFPSEKILSFSGSVRIPQAKLDPIFLQAEEMIQSKIETAQRALELEDIIDYIESWKTESKKWETRLSDVFGPQTKEWHDWNKRRLYEIESKVLAVTRAVEKDQRKMGRMVDDHLEGMKSILMLPVASMVELFPRLVRDLARSQDKVVELIITGTEIEVDKRILDELKNPLIHLLRNGVDHGIQKPDERRQINKPEHGTIRLTFSTNGMHRLKIIVSDDGSGIDGDKVCAVAVKTGCIAQEAVSKLSTGDKLSLVFHTGVSTSSIITDISGRGLGLAIVREKVEKLGGTVTIESQPGLSTTIHLSLPLSLTTFRGVLVGAGNELFFIPTLYVEHTVILNKEKIKTVENRETMQLDGQIISLVSLSQTLGLANRTNGRVTHSSDPARMASGIQVVILQHDDKRIAFQVDEIINEQQILVKDLGKQLRRVRNFVGACVLGSGKVVPVIHVSDLMKSAIKTEISSNFKRAEDGQPKKTCRILVAEDSITARALLKSILESAGYQVVTAYDGADAFAKVLTGDFNLVVTDVDMPVMSGFELTAKIRKDKKFSELPVVLVTALESPKDREYGIDVGANAYIIKSSFDQSNLLEVVGRLI